MNVPDEGMAAKDIDSNGVWHKSDGTKVDLLKNKLPVPKELNVPSEEEACLFIVPANEHVRLCPTVRLLPAKCCDMMLWYIEHPKQEREDYGLDTE